MAHIARLLNDKLIIHVGGVGPRGAGRLYNPANKQYPLSLVIRWKGKHWFELRSPIFGLGMIIRGPYMPTRNK